MKLNKVRHFHFIDDERKFKDKKDIVRNPLITKILQKYDNEVE